MPKTMQEWFPGQIKLALNNTYILEHSEESSAVPQTAPPGPPPLAPTPRPCSHYVDTVDRQRGPACGVPRESRPLPTSSCSVGGAGVGERETERVMNIILDNRWRLMSKSTLSM